MKLPIDGIQAFVVIAELGSFQKAADRLGVTQTGLTRRMQRLEAFVGLRLLDRTTRTTRLTRMGGEFLPLAKRLVEDLTTGLDRLRTTSRLALGEVTVATLQSLAVLRLPRVLALYARRYPGNRVQLVERSGALVTAAVRKAEADFGIHIHQEDEVDLEQVRLIRDPLVLVCGPGHRLAGRARLAWEELRGTDLITLGGASGNRRIVEAQLTRAGLDPRGRFVAESTPTAIALCAAGVGAAILPATSSPGVFAGGLIEVPIVDPVVHRTISLVRRRHETLTPAAAAFYELLKTELTSRTAADPDPANAPAG